ncbi:extracellular solute-binding protein [Roseomonas mucosa]|jgi:putative spermidine/putrescine transport system substrate-binding protein|nr:MULTISPECIES: extracellular solute-binding protein [Roseomonas]USQ72441.1 extracellular solute-binding protein [Roseomonas mucosa]
MLAGTLADHDADSLEKLMRLPGSSSRLTLALCLAALAAMPAARAQGPVKPGGEMVLLAYAGVFKDNYSQVVVQPFSQASGVTVQYTDPGLGGSAQMLGTLRAQKADPQVDVVIMDASTAAAACAEGLVEPLTPQALPVLKELDEQAGKVGNGCGPAVTYDHLTLIYDAEAIKVAPARWMDLAKPEYKGRSSLSAPPDIQGMALTAILAHGASGDWKNIGAAIPLLKQIVPNVQTFQPSPDAYSMVLSGQIAFGTGWNARSQLYHDQSKGKLGVLIPEEGTAFQINTINIVKGAKHREQAMAFLGHALSAGPQAAFTDRMFYGPTNLQAQKDAKAIGRTALAPEYRSRIVPIDWLEAVKLRDNWNQRWRREVMTAATR